MQYFNDLKEVQRIKIQKPIIEYALLKLHIEL